MDAADRVYCCRAADKAACTRPPCPCNLDDYSKRELRDLEDERRERNRKSKPVDAHDFDAGL